MRGWLWPYFSGSILERALAIGTLVGAGAFVYFGVAFMIGAIDREKLAMFNRRKAAS